MWKAQQGWPVEGREEEEEEEGEHLKEQFDILEHKLIHFIGKS